jgi:hypothetical protein
VKCQCDNVDELSLVHWDGLNVIGGLCENCFILLNAMMWSFVECAMGKLDCNV